jgi:lipopolysaccharide export system permease protein
MMGVLPRYVARAVLAYSALVMAVLTILIGLYLFTTQQDEIGIGRYGVPDALLFVAGNLPAQAFNLLPIGALMGALLALGNLARGSELIVMRAAGVSVFRIAGWVAIAGALLTVATWVIGDYVAPPLEQFAYQQKMLAKFNQFSVTGDEDLWAKDGNMFIAVQKQDADNSFGGMYVLRFDEQHRLQSVAHADNATQLSEQHWQLKNYLETRFDADNAIATQQVNAELHTTLSKDFISSAAKDPEQLTGRQLLSYIGHLRTNELDTREYETALWSRIARTISLLIIVMLAVPFSFGPMRSTGMGARMVLGILVGATFFLMSKLLSNAGTVYELNPLLIAWGPTTVLLLVTAVAIARVR